MDVKKQAGPRNKKEALTQGISPVAKKERKPRGKTKAISGDTLKKATSDAALSKPKKEIRTRLPLDSPYTPLDVEKEGTTPVDRGRRVEGYMSLVEIPESIAPAITLSLISHELVYLSTAPIKSKVSNECVPLCVNASPRQKGEIKKNCASRSVLPIQPTGRSLPMFLLPEEHERFVETGQLPFDTVTNKPREGQCLLCWRSDATFISYFRTLMGFVPESAVPIPFCNVVEAPQGYVRDAVVPITENTMVAKFDMSGLCWRDNPVTGYPFVDQNLIQWKDEVPMARPQGF